MPSSIAMGESSKNQAGSIEFSSEIEKKRKEDGIWTYIDEEWEVRFEDARRLASQIARRACFKKSHVRSPVRFKTVSVKEEEVDVEVVQ